MPTRESLELIDRDIHAIIMELNNPSAELIAINDNIAYGGSSTYSEVKEFTKWFQERYPYLYANSPSLFEMVIGLYPQDPNTFMKHYDTMMRASLNIADGNCSKSDIEVTIGEQLKETYIDPVMPNMKRRNMNEPHVVTSIGDETTEVNITTESLNERLHK
jgi:hypothetical protein